MDKKEFLKKYYYLLTGLFVFIIYLTTLAPTVVKIDSGELSAVQSTLGIAHPTGYPLFTIVGFLFSLIPLPFSSIYKMNLLAAIWCAAGTSVFVYTAKYVLDNIEIFNSEYSLNKININKSKKLSEAETPNFSDLSPYYQQEFQQIYENNQKYKGKWNWSAFFFTWIWALTKGIIGMAVLIFFIGIGAYFTYGIVGLIIALILGARGNFIYYKKYRIENPNHFLVKDITIEKKTDEKISKTIKKRHKTKDKRKTEKKEISEFARIIASIFGCLILAFSRTFWMQSTSVEVYSLHILLISLVILFLVKGFVEEDPAKILSKNWILFSVLLALGFTNHMTTLLILPGVAYLFFIKYKFTKKSFTKIGFMLLIFFPTLILIYSYLPISASQNPSLNWGNPIDFERIYRHITGKQYQVWLTFFTESAKKQLGYFFNTLPVEFSINLLIAFIGIVVSFSIAKRFGIFILLTFVSTILYSINYDIVDIDSYFLLAYIAIGFFSLFGIIKLLSFVKIKNSYNVIAALISLFILVQIFITYPRVDESNTFIYEDYTKEILGGVSKNAIVFSYQWDYFLSASYYFQLVEKYRKDVVVIDKELLRRSWYYNQLEKNYPGVFDELLNEKELFLNALKPFEKDEKFDSNLLENLFRRIMTGLISTNINKRDFYIGPELFEGEMQKGEFVLPESYSLIPDGFLFKVVKNTNDYIPSASPDFKIRVPERKDKYIENIINMFICPMLIRRALYEVQFDKVDKAKLYIEKIKKDFPDYKIPEGIKQAVGM